MDVLDEILDEVSAGMPPFDDYLLREFPRRQIDSAPDYFEMLFREACRLVQPHLTYEGYRILPPEERAEYEIRERRVMTTVTEAVLIEYRFLFREQLPDGGTTVHRLTSMLYIPYLKDNVLVINGKRQAVLKGITEKIFSRMNNGVMVRVPRAPIRFLREKIQSFKSAVTGQIWHEYVIHVTLWLKKRTKRAPSANVIHYMLCHYGFPQTMQQFGFDENDIDIVSSFSGTDPDYDYICVSDTRSDIYVRVRSRLLNDEHDPTMRKILANLLYVCQLEELYTLRDLRQGLTWWRRCLGKVIRYPEEVNDIVAESQAAGHLSSVLHFLDPGSRARFRTFGLHVNDIYDLLRAVFVDIDHVMVNTTHQDLYSKRVDLIEGLFLKNGCFQIMRRFYVAELRGRLIKREAQRLLKLSPIIPLRTWESRLTETLQTYGSNWLLTCGAAKVRLNSAMGTSATSTSAPEARMHPSIPVVETMYACKGSSPGVTGLINPFCPISEEGGIIKPDYATHMDKLLEHLPHR